MKTDEEIAQEVRDKLSYMSNKQTVEAIAKQSVRYYHDNIKRQAKLKDLKNLPTYEDDNISHDPLANRCMCCGRWLVAENWNGEYGMSWICPAKLCGSARW